MPCALTEPDNYPDYLKTILKEINAGDNDELKACACSLKSPTTDEGCLILDENNKVGAFPFCSTLVTSGVGDDTDYPLKLTLKQAMNLYWKTTDWEFSAKSNSSSTAGNTWYQNFTGKKRISVNFNQVGPPPPSRNLVCQNYFQYPSDYAGQACYNGACSPLEGSYITATMFEGSPEMKYKNEGGTYYFYPKFYIIVGNYSICASQTQTSAEDCVASIFGGQDNGTIQVTPIILGESCNPLKLYVRKFTGGYSGSVTVSFLKFT